jgi:hypothetical protein
MEMTEKEKQVNRNLNLFNELIYLSIVLSITKTVKDKTHISKKKLQFDQKILSNYVVNIT